MPTSRAYALAFLALVGRVSETAEA